MDNTSAAMHAIELLRHELTDSAVFAIGSMSQPQVIVSAMRAGASEFIERPTTTTDLLEAFIRLSATNARSNGRPARQSLYGRERQRRQRSHHHRSQSGFRPAISPRSIALVDLAPLGHAALHLNLKPLFTISDATRNLHRMDSSLLESFMTSHYGGLQLLAGTNAPAAIEPSSAEFVRLFDMMVGHFQLCRG